jgi:hypothetical protein
MAKKAETKEVPECGVLAASWAEPGPPGFSITDIMDVGEQLSTGAARTAKAAPKKRGLSPYDAPFAFSYSSKQQDQADPAKQFTKSGAVRRDVTCGSRIPVRIEEGGCGAQLDWKGGKALLRLCKGLGDSDTIEVENPLEAQELSKAACVVFKRDGNFNAFLKEHKDKVRHAELLSPPVAAKKPRKKKTTTKALKGVSGDCPYGVYKSGRRKGQCRLAPVKGAARARKVR